MKIYYKVIEPEQFFKVSEIFNVNLSNLKNYVNCFGAFLENEIIGILSLIKEDEDRIWINFFHVLPLFRCNNIGSTLLKLAEKFSVSIHSKKMTVKYNDAENNIERCSQFFYKNGWDSIKYMHTRYCFEKESFEKNFILKFFNTENTVSNTEIHFIFFNELSEEKRDKIKKQSEKMLSNGLLPFNALDSMVKDLSIFAFFYETLIAWSTVDFIKYNEISIRSTFVVNEYRNSGLGIYLWYLIFCQANKNRNFDLIKWISFDFQKDNDRLNKLYTLLFEKFLEQSIDYYISEKVLI
jgi:GNAT superfamily N-acetyltransferase